MNRIVLIILALWIAGMLAPASGLWAHEDHMTIQAASPFEAAKAKKKVHCELKRHQHARQKICPHTLPGRNPEKQLRTDCGGSSTGVSVSVSQPHPLALFAPVGKASSAAPTRALTPRRIPPGFSIPNSLDRPPRQI